MRIRTTSAVNARNAIGVILQGTKITYAESGVNGFIRTDVMVGDKPISTVLAAKRHFAVDDQAMTAVALDGVNARGLVCTIPAGVELDCEESDVPGFYRAVISIGGTVLPTISVLIAARYTERIDQITPPVVPLADNMWHATYWANNSLSGAAIKSDIVSSELAFDWGTGSPDTSVPADRFSARYVRESEYAAERYRWTVTADDGFRLWIDNTLILDQWREQPATPYQATVELGKGVHKEVVEYFEQGGRASLSVKREVAPIVVTPPLVTTYRRGIGLHMMQGWGVSDQAGQCRDFLYMDDIDSCRRMADKLGKTAALDGRGLIMHRHYFDHWPAAAEVMEKNNVGIDSRIITIVSNECEFLNKPGAEGILYHAELDLHVAEMAADAGCHVAVGTYAVGNPDITDYRVIDALRKGYADWWNTFEARNKARGKDVKPVWDQHEYSPYPDHIFNTWEGDITFVTGPAPTALVAQNNYLVDYYVSNGQPIVQPQSGRVVEYAGRNNTPVWRLRPNDGQGGSGAATKTVHICETDWHETRPSFLFTLCGFNLNCGAMVSSETGLDQGGKGGFVGAGLYALDVNRWCKRFKDIWARPIHDDFGNHKPMPKEGSTLFMAGNSPRWASYDVRKYIAEMTNLFA